MLQPLQPPQPRAPPQPLQPRAPLQPPQPLPRWATCWPDRSASLSKTKNVPKLTSDISSSLRLIGGGVSRTCRSGVGPTAPVADAPPATARDKPTTPATGAAFFSCFRFVCGIVDSNYYLPDALHCSLQGQHFASCRPGIRIASRAKGSKMVSSEEVSLGQRVAARLVPLCRKKHIRARSVEFSLTLKPLGVHFGGDSPSEAVREQGQAIGGIKAAPSSSLVRMRAWGGLAGSNRRIRHG